MLVIKENAKNVSRSSMQTVHDSGKAIQLLCEPVAQGVATTSMMGCALMYLTCFLESDALRPVKPRLLDQDQEMASKGLFDDDIHAVGVCGAGIIRGSAYAFGSFFGGLRAMGQPCVGSLKTTDTIAGYTADQINQAPGVLDKINLTPTMNR